MRGDTATMTARRQILITEDDMARLRELVQRGRMASPRDQAHLEELEQELDRAEVVAAEDLSPDVVTMHSTVRVRDLDDGITAVYTVVFPTEADIDRKRISVLAPIGTALIGYRAGDVIEWATPGRTRRLQIEDVLFQPEAAGGREHERASAAGRPSRSGTREAMWRCRKTSGCDVRVLLASDASGDSRRATRWVRDFPLPSDTKVSVVTVATVTEPPREAQTMRQLRERAVAQARRAAERAGDVAAGTWYRPP